MSDNQIISTMPSAPKRKRKASTPRGPRVVDPGIKAIHDDAKKQVAKYRKAARSAGILAGILKKLPSLTGSDRNLLFNESRYPTAATTTPEEA